MQNDKKAEKAATEQEYILCMVTHPKMPNPSGHARGRVIHKSLDGKKSVCNMLVDKTYPEDKVHIIQYRRKCKICFK